MRRKLAAIVVLGLVISLKGAPVPAPAHIDVTVHEGTSMSVAVSPDGRTLAVDLQGSIWTLPASGGTAKRITDIFNDARQPAFSHDGKSAWAVSLADGRERKAASAAGRVDAPSWGAGGQIVYHVTTGGGRGASGGGPESSRYEIGGKTITGSENVFAFRAAWASATEFYYVSDGKIRKRGVDGSAAQTIEFSATLKVTRAAGSYTRRKRDFTSIVPRPVLGVVHPALSPDGKQIAFAALGDIYVMPAGGKPATVTKDAALDTEPAWSPAGTQLA